MKDLYVYELVNPDTEEVLSTHDDLHNAEAGLLLYGEQNTEIVLRRLNPFEKFTPERAYHLITELRDRGVSFVTIAEVLEVTPLTVRNWVKRCRTGNLSPRQMVKLSGMSRVFLR